MSKVLRYLAWTAVGLVLIGVVARLVAVRTYTVPTNDPYLEASLLPTLHGGDWIVLWRLTAPAYGDLALCQEPKAPPVCTGEGSEKRCHPRMVIGRILGVGGDQVVVEGASVKRNGRSLVSQQACPERKFTGFDPGNEQRDPLIQFCDMEASAGTNVHPRGSVIPDEIAPTRVDERVPPGYVFLVSDNRQFPWDSREFGPVPVKDCTEKVVLRLTSKKGWFDADNRLNLIH